MDLIKWVIYYFLLSRRFFCWVIYPWSVTLSLELCCSPGSAFVWENRICTWPTESLSITELVLVKHEQELISGTFVSPDSKTPLKMLGLPNLCSFQMGGSGLAWGSPSRLLRSSLISLLLVPGVDGSTFPGLWLCGWIC